MILPNIHRLLGALLLLSFFLGCRSTSMEASGFIEGEEFLVRSPYPAKVEKVFVQEGEKVQHGQALAALDSESLLVSLKNAEAALTLIDAELERVRSLVGRLPSGGGAAPGFYARVKRLYEVGGVSRSQLEQARKASAPVNRRGQAEYFIKELEAKRAEAEAKLHELEVFARESVLKAPADGIVTKRYVQGGQVLEKADPCFLITDAEKVYLKTTLPRRELAKVQIGQQVEVSLAAFPQQRFEGQLVEIDKAAIPLLSEVPTQEEQESARHGVTVRISNPKGIFKPGMIAKAKFSLQEEVLSGNFEP